MTTIDELESKWMEHDRKLDAMLSLNRQLLTRASLAGARTALRRQILFAALSALTAFTVAPLMGFFIALNHAEPRFVLPAALISVYFIAAAAVHSWQVGTLAHINYAEPIATLQRQIGAAVRMRIRLARSIGMSMVLLWVPITIVAAKAWLKLDLYVMAPGWLIANTIFGLFWWWLVWSWSKRAAARSNSPRIQRLLRDIAGDNLNAASAFLSTLGEFEREDPVS